MMRWMLLLWMAPTAAIASTGDCKGIFARYKGKLEEAKYEGKSYRKLTFEYLRALESSFKRCFVQKEGKALIAKRVKTEKAAPLQKPKAKKDGARSAPTSPRFSYSTDSDSTSVDWSSSSRIHPASAAFLSLIAPGAGQAVQNRPGAAWLFFFGATVPYAISGIILGTGFDPKKGKINDGAWVGFGILAGIGFLVHVSAVINAGIYRR